MRTFQTVCTRLGAPVTPRPLALALALALGVTPLAGMAATLITVTTSGDGGSGSTCTLRQAIESMNAHTIAGTNCANSGSLVETINFDITTFPIGGINTILLSDVSTGTLQVTDSVLTIDASANGGVTIERPNSASYSFGILNDSAPGGSLTLKHLTLKGGATGACGDKGGGICASNVNLTLIDSTLSGNSSTFRGGGIFSGYGSVTLTNSTLSGNSSGDGGGIHSLHSSVALTNSTLSGNSAANGAGGGIEALTSNISVTNSTLSANTAKFGGGMDSNSSTVTLINSTLSGNSASQSGGALYTSLGDSLTLVNCTVSANGAGYNGGINSSAFQFTVVNSIVAGNAGSDLNPIFLSGGSSGNYIGGNPQLDALADNGGLTQTMLPQPGSAVIDAIACTNAPATDQRGIARPQGVQCDIGAVELGHPLSLTVDTTADTEVVDGKCSLREAIAIFTQGRTGSDCPPGASAANRILFAPALASGSIVVASPLALNNNVEVTIDGSGAPSVAIDGGNTTLMFNVSVGSAVTIQHLQMVNGSGGSNGGAIANAGTLTLTDTAVDNNASDSSGGAIRNSGTLNINRSTFSNNIALGSGGAIDVEDGVLTMTDSTVIDNLAAGAGGVFLATSGTLNLSGSNISTNHALSAGGGGVAGNGHFIIGNSTFFGNTAATDGGAVYNNKAANINKIVNSTIAGNTATNGGNLANAAGTLLLQNSIVANSSAGSNCSGAITPGTGFLTWPASDVTCGAFTVANPVLGPLQNNGGPSFTMLPGAGSAALDTGNTTTCASAPVNNLDQRGVLRPQGAGCDIGAVEVVSGRIFAGNFEGTPTP